MLRRFVPCETVSIRVPCPRCRHPARRPSDQPSRGRTRRQRGRSAQLGPSRPHPPRRDHRRHDQRERRASASAQADPRVGAPGGDLDQGVGVPGRGATAPKRVHPVIDRLVDAGLPAKVCCRVLGVSSPGYYKYRTRPISPTRMRRQWLTGLIREVHLASRGTYGSRRVHAELTIGMDVRQRAARRGPDEQHRDLRAAGAGADQTRARPGHRRRPGQSQIRASATERAVGQRNAGHTTSSMSGRPRSGREPSQPADVFLQASSGRADVTSRRTPTGSEAVGFNSVSEGRHATYAHAYGPHDARPRLGID